MTDTFCRQMTEELGALGISLNDGQMNQFYRYYEMLVEKNKVMNLTAITEEREVVTKHFSDSLSLVKAFTDSGVVASDLTNISSALGVFPAGTSLIDVGTGAGFPGIPLKIAFPQLKVTLLDSLNKRVNFLKEVCEELGLKEILCVHGRAEDAGRDTAHREKYDICVSRAVANLASLSEYCMPFVKIGGYFIPYKSGGAEEEIAGADRAISLLGGKREEMISFTLPNSDLSRCLVKIKKERAISRKYPRKAGLPTKEPLM